jgi:hypothetical protein
MAWKMKNPQYWIRWLPRRRKRISAMKYLNDELNRKKLRSLPTTELEYCLTYGERLDCIPCTVYSMVWNILKNDYIQNSTDYFRPYGV